MLTATCKHNCLTYPPLFCTVTQSTVMAGIAAQLLGIVADDNSYRDESKGSKAAIVSLCYTSLCLNLVAPISTIFFFIRLGSISVDEMKRLSVLLNKRRCGAVPHAPRLRFGTIIVLHSCEFQYITLPLSILSARQSSLYTDNSHRVDLVRFW